MAIPKIIHYCWFGGKEKPDNVQKCIESWKKYLPEYKLIEWNEQNFEVNNLRYTKEAYHAGKYAFVSDVARIEALYKYGGIYMDTDVEVLRTFNSLLDAKCILGMEEKECIITEDALDAVISRYSNTSGIRDLEQAAEHIAANALYQIEVNHVSSVEFTREMVEELLK